MKGIGKEKARILLALFLNTEIILYLMKPTLCLIYFLSMLEWSLHYLL